MKKAVIAVVCTVLLASMVFVPNVLAQEGIKDGNPFAHIPKSKEPVPVTIYYTDSGDIKEVKIGHLPVCGDTVSANQDIENSLRSADGSDTFRSNISWVWNGTKDMDLDAGEYMRYDTFNSSPTGDQFFLGMYNGSYGVGYVVTSSASNLYVQAPATDTWRAKIYYYGDLDLIYISGGYSWAY